MKEDWGFYSFHCVGSCSGGGFKLAVRTAAAAGSHWTCWQFQEFSAQSPADLTTPFYLAVSGQLACRGWGKRYWICYYNHLPGQLLRSHMFHSLWTLHICVNS